MPNQDVSTRLVDKMFEVSQWGSFILVAVLIILIIILGFIIKNKVNSSNKQKNVIKGDVNNSEINNVKNVK